MASNTLSSVKKARAKKNKKEDWETFGSSLNSSTTINQALNRVRSLKGKDKKKIKHS